MSKENTTATEVKENEKKVKQAQQIKEALGTTRGHARRYAHLYASIEACLATLKKGVDYNPDMTSKENRTRLASAILKCKDAPRKANKDLLAVGTLRDVIREYFSTQTHIHSALHSVLRVDTQKEVKKFTAVGEHAFKRVLREQKEENA